MTRGGTKRIAEWCGSRCLQPIRSGPVRPGELRDRSAGFITAEVILWLTLLFFIFVGVFHLAAKAWIQIRVEDAAWSIAQWAYQHPEAQDPPGSGTLVASLFDGRGTASIWWSNQTVRVRIEAEGGNQITERRFPLEVP